METAGYMNNVIDGHREYMKNQLKMTCDFLPVACGIKEYRKCRDKVSYNFATVINKLVGILDPEYVCQLLGRCPWRKTAGIPNTKHPERLIARGRHGDVDVN